MGMLWFSNKLLSQCQNAVQTTATQRADVKPVKQRLTPCGKWGSRPRVVRSCFNKWKLWNSLTELMSVNCLTRNLKSVIEKQSREPLLALLKQLLRPVPLWAGALLLTSGDPEHFIRAERRGKSLSACPGKSQSAKLQAFLFSHDWITCWIFKSGFCFP